jgi:two-component system, cell cycle sensor histidine kinase and response regulator CckA
MGAKAKPALQKKTRKKKVSAPAGIEITGDALLGLSRDPVLVVDQAKLRVVSCNAAACELYGYSNEELKKHSLLDLCPERERVIAERKLRQVALGKKEFHHLRGDSSSVFVEFETVPISYEGQPAFLCHIHDITIRSQLIRALLESDATNREVIENASDIIYTHDLEGNLLSGNKAATAILGYSREDYVGLNIANLVAPEDLAQVRRSIQDKIEGKHTAISYPLHVLGKDGTRHALEVNTRLIYRDGQPVAVQGVARDVTDRERTEQALLESEAKFRAMAEGAPCGIAIYQDECLRYTNRMMTQIFGYAQEELVNTESVWNVILPEFREMVRTRANARLRGESLPRGYEFRIRHKNGSERWVDFTAGLFEYEGRSASLITLFDITERKQAQAQADQAQQLFRLVVEKSTDLISILAADGTIKFESPSVESVLGWKAEELIGKDSFDYVHPDDVVEAKRLLASGFSQPPSNTAEMRLRHKDGSYKVFEAASSQIVEDGITTALIINFRDVSERRRQQEDLRASEEKYRQLFERNLAGVFVSDVDGTLIDCNDSFAHIFGYRDRTEALCQPASQFYVSGSSRADFISKLRRTKYLTNHEYRCRRKDGSSFWVLENVALLESKNGTPERIQGTLIDITERKEAEEALIESESKFRAVADTASSAIYIHNGKNFLYLNRASEEITGYTATELLHLPVVNIVHPDDKPLVMQRSLARLEGSPADSRYEFRIVRKDGSYGWLDFSGTTVTFEGETAVLATAFDITERKRSERLQNALYRIAEASHSIRDLPQFYAEIHRIVAELMYANNLYIALYDPWAETLTYPYYADELDEPPTGELPLGKGRTEYVLRTGRPILLTPEKFEALAHAGEMELVGSACVDWIGVPLKDGSKTFGVLVVQSYKESVRYFDRDLEVLNFVSQQVSSAILRKKNEDALRESESQYRSTVQSAVYGIYRSSADDYFLEVNPALVRMLGYDSAHDLLKMKISTEVYSDPSERAQLIERYRSTGVMENVEVRWKRKDGKLITVRLSGRGVPGADGSTEYFEMIAEDVTERRALEEQLRQSQKMEAVGRLAGGIAHDFNNLLTVIKGYSDLLLEEFKPADPLRNEVDEIRKAADRAASLTRQLLAFSRQQVLAPKVLDLNSVVGNMDRLLRRLLGADIDLQTSLANALGRVKADPGQIEQVIMNLAVNARDAMPKGGKLTVETANVMLDDHYALEHIGAQAGNYVMLSVTDNGLGMSESVRQRIFEPFFTTKEVGKGTGLGLSTVYGIVKQSGGYIWVYSEIGVGSTFKVYLPRVDAPADVATQKLSSYTTHAGTETVLLVEDEDGVRALVRQVLSKHGYTVLEARHGGEALLHCERFKEKIHLLITDVVLEQMSGPELAQRLVQLRTDLKVLYVSGYTDDAIIHQGVLKHGTAFLQKPFTTDALARKIREILDETQQ